MDKIIKSFTPTFILSFYFSAEIFTTLVHILSPIANILLAFVGSFINQSLIKIIERHWVNKKNTSNYGESTKSDVKTDIDK